MLHIYRQITGLARLRPVVITQKREYAERFPFDNIRIVPKAATHFLRRIWFRQLRDLPWKISSFNGTGIEQPGMDHVGFRVGALPAFKAHVDKIARTNIHLAPKPLDFDSEGAARLALLRKCAFGSFQLADPDGTLIDVEEAH